MTTHEAETRGSTSKAAANQTFGKNCISKAYSGNNSFFQAKSISNSNILIQRDAPAQTVEETNIVVTPEEQAAWKAGYDDGLAGAKSNAIDRVGFQYAQDYLNGFEEGTADAKNGIVPSDDNSYNGPSIGPAPSDEQSEKDRKAFEDAEEQRREFLKELGQEPPEDENKRPREAEPFYEVPELVE